MVPICSDFLLREQRRATVTGTQQEVGGKLSDLCSFSAADVPFHPVASSLGKQATSFSPPRNFHSCLHASLSSSRQVLSLDPPFMSTAKFKFCTSSCWWVFVEIVTLGSAAHYCNYSRLHPMLTICIQHRFGVCEIEYMIVKCSCKPQSMKSPLTHEPIRQIFPYVGVPNI